MTIYYVIVEETEINTYKIEAEDPDEAEGNYYDGDCVFSKYCQSEILDIREEF